MKHYDVTIIGGGIVGRALAAALRNKAACKRLNIALIDALPPVNLPLSRDDNDLSTYSNRVSSVTAKNYEYLKELCGGGVNSEILDKHSKPFNSIMVWDCDEPKSRINLKSPSMMGRIVENNSIIFSLQQTAKDTIDFYNERVSLEETERRDGTDYSHDHCHDDKVVKLRIGDDKEITSNLVIGADGKESIVRKLIKPDVFGRHYDQKGIVATIRIKKGQNMTAFQRFLPSGPCALLPIDSNVVSMVWTLPTAIADKLIQSKLSPQSWLLLIKSAQRLLNSDVQYFLNHPELLTEDEFKWRHSCLDKHQKALTDQFLELEEISPSSIAAFPLSMSIARQTVAANAITIGDAAHVIHPLAGQGANLGIADVKELANIINDAASIGADLGDVDLYKTYEKKRLAASMAMAGFCDSIHRIFDSSFPAPFLRSMGMRIFDQSLMLKRLAIRAAQL